MRTALVTCELTGGGLERLAALGYDVTTAGWGWTGTALSPDELGVAAAGCHLLLVEVEQVTASVLAALPDLRILGAARGNPTNIDLAAAAARDLPVLCTPGRNAASVADATVGLLLMLARKLDRAQEHLRATGWQVPTETGPQLPYLHFRGPELAGRTVGIVGYGAVGREVHRRLVDGFGMHALICDPHVSDVATVDLPTLLTSSDVVTLHCPAVRLLDEARLALLAPHAYLINTARADVVDEAALVEALRAGRLAGAALDVFGTEPLPATSPLLRVPHVVLTPHIAGAADDVVAHHTAMLVGDIERLHRGAAPRHQAG